MKGRKVTEHAKLSVWNTWGQYVAVAAAYGALYQLTHYASSAQFLLTAGLRLAFLLLLPIRFWPALALGEGLPLIENAILCEPRFGLPWAISASVPMVVLWMAVIKPMRLRWSVYGSDGRVRMGMILTAVLACSIITAAATTLTVLAAMPTAAPGKWSETPMGDYFWAFLLGAYLGALTLTPVILAMYERMRALQGTPLRLEMIVRSPLFQETICWVTPALFGLVWLAEATPNAAVREVAQLSLLWPAAGLAWRHHWHGAAVGGMGASIALAATAHGLLDPATLRIQVILALVLSATLLTSARVPATRAVGRPERS